MLLALAVIGLPRAAGGADEKKKVQLPIVAGAELQPLRAQATRIAQALELLGSPLTADERKALDRALAEDDPAKSSRQIQEALDALCLAGVNVNPESRVKATAGPAAKELMQQGWRVFLVKVHNEAGVTARLRVSSPNAQPVYERGSNRPVAVKKISPAELADRWLDLEMFDRQPLNETLSGLAVEYRVIQLHSRDAGKREAKLMFDVGQGTQDLGFRNELNLLFQCRPAVEVVLSVLDDDGTPTMGQFVFRDSLGRVYPS
ncbi:MAG: hypothetical protein WD403_06975, partial [Pirellulales bacterium]